MATQLDTIITLAKGFGEALVEGKTKKAEEYRHALARQNMGLISGGTGSAKALTAATIPSNWAFDKGQVERATAIHCWGTTMSFRGDDFTLFVMIGANGAALTHRVIKGF
jgi:hypothetical protein